jgi:POT family proton-dependent oligopeptide transporter
MTAGFFFTAAGIAYAAGVQKWIYSSGPCFQYPLECPESIQEDSSNFGQRSPNTLSVWHQTPLLFLLAIGEILGLVALNEYIYAEAPTNLKAMVQALQFLSSAVGAALGAALGSVARNPWLVILFSCLAGTMGLSTALFWAAFRKRDAVYAKHEAEAETVGVVETGNEVSEVKADDEAKTRPLEGLEVSNSKTI